MAARAGGNASSAMTRREGGPVPRGGGGQGAAQQDRYQPGPLPPGGPPGLAGGVPQQAAQGGRGTAPGLRLLLGQQCVRPHHGRAMAELADESDITKSEASKIISKLKSMNKRKKRK